MRPHRRQPTRLPHPWDSPGKNTGVGCHFLFQLMKVKSESEVAQSCPTLSDCMDCSLPGSSVHGIFQARVLEWGAIAFSRQCRRPQFNSWVGKIPWRRDRLPTPVFLGFPGGSDIKKSTCNAAGRPGFHPWVGKIPWSKAWRLTPVFLPGESPWTEEPGGLPSIGSQVWHDWATKHSSGSSDEVFRKANPSSTCYANKTQLHLHGVCVNILSTGKYQSTFIIFFCEVFIQWVTILVSQQYCPLGSSTCLHVNGSTISIPLYGSQY